MTEALIIFAFMGVGAILDRLHHGTPIKPYDWELEES